MCGNFLPELPPHLESMADFWNLFINDNKLTSLPTWILELNSLRRFSFAGNPIPPSLEQRQLAANVQMSMNLRTLARQGAAAVAYKPPCCSECSREFISIADACRAAQAAESLARQEEERQRLQDALKCERMRMAALNAAMQSSGQDDALGGDCDASELQGGVTLSRIGRGKLLKVEGQVLLYRLSVHVHAV